jgi:hypothetical protein
MGAIPTGEQVPLNIPGRSLATFKVELNNKRALNKF